MSNIEKTAIKTAGGVEALLNPSINYEQDRSIMGAYLEEGLSKVQVMEKADRLGIEAVVFSLTGSTEGIYERFKKLPLADAREIVKAIKSVLDPKAPTPAAIEVEKKTS